VAPRAASCPAFCRQWPSFVWFCWRCWPSPRSRTCTPANLTPTIASCALSCTRWCPLLLLRPPSSSCNWELPRPRPIPSSLLTSGKSASSFALLPSPARASLRFHSGPRIRPMLYRSGDAWPHLHTLISKRTDAPSLKTPRRHVSRPAFPHSSAIFQEILP